jgi:hypothetical protein
MVRSPFVNHFASFTILFADFFSPIFYEDPPANQRINPRMPMTMR